MLVADVQAAIGAPSSEHWGLETASVGLNVKPAEVPVVGFVGSELGAIVTPIVVGSRSMADSVPVAPVAAECRPGPDTAGDGD